MRDDLYGVQIAAVVGVACLCLGAAGGCARYASAEPDDARFSDPPATAQVAQGQPQQPRASFQPPFSPPAPAVSRAFETWTLGETVEDAMARIGSPTLPELRRWLSDPNPVMRRTAADLIGRIGPEAESVVPELIILLDDEDSEVRKYAARALGRIGPASAAAVPALGRVLREEILKEQTRVQDTLRR